MKRTKLEPGDYREVPWKNGGGTTTEVLIEPPEATLETGFLYRLSMARVERSGPFSSFAGYDRTILLLEGGGMTLDFGAGRQARLWRRHEPVAFRGEWTTHGALLGGPSLDLNVMVDRARAAHEVRVLTVGAAEVRHPLARITLFFVLQGSVAVDDVSLGCYETFHIVGGAGEATLRGEGVVLAVAIYAWEATLSDFELRRLWTHDDAEVRRQALGEMTQAQADLVEPIAADPAHPWHKDAIETLAWNFVAPRFVALRVAAMSHADPAVRAEAAHSLLYDEPIAAEAALVAAVMDPAPEVVEQVTLVLQYYPTQAVLRGLHAHPADGPLHDEVEGTFDHLRDEFLRELRRSGFAPALRRWMEPVWDLLAFTAEELGPQEETPLSDRPPERPVVETAEELRPLCVAPVADVRAQALHQLSRLPPDPHLAAFAWQRFQEESLGFWCSMEALAAYETHAERGEAARRLRLIALDEDRPEHLRLSALCTLNEWGEVAALRELLPLLLHPPLMTWHVHRELLKAAREHALPLPDGAVHALHEVDHLAVQAALASFAPPPPAPAPPR